MKEELTSLAKSAAKSSAKIFFFSLLALFLGFIFNLILLAFCFPEIQAMTTQIGSMPIARAGGIGAILALIIILLALWPVILLIVVFIIGFPFAYLLAAKKYAVGREISKLLSKHKVWFTDNISHFLSETLKKKVESAKTGGTKEFILEKLKDIPSLLKEQDSWPPVVRFFVQKILKSLHIQDITQEISKKYSEQETPDSNFLEETIKAGLNKAVDQKLEPSPPKLLYILIVVNFVIFLGVKIFI